MMNSLRPAELSALGAQLQAQQLMDYATARAMFDKCFAFASSLAKKEPSLAQVRDFLCLIEEKELREALQIAPPEKYTMKIKPSCWKSDVTRWFSVILLCYTAWGEDAA